jgi:hypothetical protein
MPVVAFFSLVDIALKYEVSKPLKVIFASLVDE